MNLDIQTIKDASLEVLLIGVAVFLLTLLIKWPIKRATAALAEPKRKAVNVVIVLIPPVLSLIASELFLGIAHRQWLSLQVFPTMLSAWLVAVSVYGVYSKVVILIKAAISKKAIDPQLTKEAVAQLKQGIKDVTTKLNVDQKNLKALEKVQQALTATKAMLEQSGSITDLAQTNISLKCIEGQTAELKGQMQLAEQTLQTYKKTLYKSEGENK